MRKRLLLYGVRYKREILCDLLCSLIRSIVVTFIPISIKYLMKNVLDLKLHREYVICLFMAIAFLVLISLCEKYMEYHGNTFVTKLESDIKLDLFNHIQKQSFSFFDENKIGNLMSYIIVDAHNLAVFTKKFPEILLDFSIKFVGTIIVLLNTNYLFGLIIFSIIMLILFCALYFTVKIQKEVGKSKTAYSEIVSNLKERLTAVRTVQAFTAENQMLSQFNDDINLFIKTMDERFNLESKMKSFIKPILFGIAPIISVVSIAFILDGQMTFNDLTIFMLYTNILISPICKLFGLISDFNENLASLKRISDIFSVNPEIIDSDNALDLKKIRGKITFNNVSFEYKSSCKPVIRNINLEIHPGEHIALVGKSGVGKSSICNLIPRFYDVTNGEILLDDISIKNIKLKDLRENITFVQQDTFLFSGTIIENIRYGRLDATDEEVYEAAKNAYADDFILKLKNGYQTRIGERGVKLSGGQKQRIAIARAFLKNSPILIFDEATSNLDSESEKFIQKSIEMLSKNRTTIIVAHRLSTIKNVDRIIVLGSQTIQEEGTHQELLSNNGFYKRLYDKQLFMNK